MKKLFILFSVLFSILIGLNTVNAACPCDCDNDGSNSVVCLGPDCDDDNDGFDITGFPALCPGGTDCNDGNPAINPGAAEVLCNCVNDDCNAGTPDTPADGDGDGHDVCGSADACNPDGNEADCNDGNGRVYPNAIESCDNIDNQCPGDAGFGSVDEGCDDDGDDYCDWILYCTGPPPVCPLGCGDCDDIDGTIHPPNVDENAAGLCDGIDNDCDLDADENCPMSTPSITVEYGGVPIVGPPPKPMSMCNTVGAITTCYYLVGGNPDFKKEGTYTVNVTWPMPVGSTVSINILIDHDNNETSCNCFYPSDCKGFSCWLLGLGGFEINPPDIEPWCCGDDLEEHYVGGTDGTFACCDNKNTPAGTPLAADECVIGGVCQNRIVGPNEDGSPGLCDGIDNDCDGRVDENCGCDSAKFSCDTNVTCPILRCKDGIGAPKSCWGVGGDSGFAGSSACCGLNASFPNTPGEYYVWNLCDGTDACCDNRDRGGVPLAGQECVLRGTCMNYAPIANEVACDFIDEDCDCLIDEDFDNDNDSVPSCAGDCNNNNATIYPGAPEICGDGVDQDCDGEDTLCGKPEEATLGNLCRLVYDTIYLLTYIVAAITVLLLAIGGLSLTGAQGPRGESEAKNMIKNALIGLIVFFAFVGVSDMYVPECVPLPGDGYNPPLRYKEPPSISVKIIRPTNMEFFEETDIVIYDSLIFGGSPPYNYVWDFGDGTPTVFGSCATGVCPLGTTHTYAKGRYKIKLVVTDSAGKKAWDEVEILVGIIVAEIVEPKDKFVGIQGNNIDFKSLFYGGVGPFTFQWTSDIDGVLSVAQNFTTSFATNGRRLITFTVIDSTGRTASDSIYITIVSNVPTITNAEWCWKDGWAVEDETIFRFNIQFANPTNAVLEIAVMKTGDCGILDCCTMDTWLYEHKFFSLGLVPAGPPGFDFMYIDFCERAEHLQILVKDGVGNEWAFCAECIQKGDTPSKYCPGEYGDALEDFKPCTVTLGYCETPIECYRGICWEVKF